MRILAVEGEPGELRRLTDRIRRAGWAVDGARTIQVARKNLVDTPYDGVVMSRTLVDGDALSLMGDVADGAGVVVIGEPEGTEERAVVLEAGADDCIDRPVDLEEMVVRLARVLVRRTSTSAGPVHIGRVVVDRVGRTASVDGAPVRLTPTQLCLLDHLVTHRHRVVGTGELLEHCWDARRGLLSNPLASQMNRLRNAFRGALVFRWVEPDGYLVEAGE